MARLLPAASDYRFPGGRGAVANALPTLIDEGARGKCQDELRGRWRELLARAAKQIEDLLVKQDYAAIAPQCSEAQRVEQLMPDEPPAEFKAVFNLAKSAETMHKILCQPLDDGAAGDFRSRAWRRRASCWRGASIRP